MTAINQTTGFLVVRTARSMKKMLDARLAEFGITTSQHMVLSTLAKDDGLSLTEIGKRVYLDKPAITGLADRLEKDRLVKRKRIPSDRRVIKLWLTEKGRSLLSRFETVVTGTDEELVQVLSPSELIIFREMLDRIWWNANGNSNELL
ncbi:MAG: MarR family winged helix-turn-helix transcriptional regulator [Fidelibacterota bacterium]